MNTTTPNALLAAADLPLFDAITPEQVGPAVDQLLADANAALERVTAPDFPADWKAMANVLDVATERLGRASSRTSRRRPRCDRLRTSRSSTTRPRTSRFPIARRGG